MLTKVSGDEAFNFVLTELVDFSDPGLIILPPHRLVRGMSKSTLNGLMSKLKSFFEIEELPLSMPDVWQQVDDLLVGEASQVRLFFLVWQQSVFLCLGCVTLLPPAK